MEVSPFEISTTIEANTNFILRLLITFNALFNYYSTYLMREKVTAIEVWPEDLTNDTQVKQFLGTIIYCRTFMGSAFADLARPLVELPREAWTSNGRTSTRKQ